MDLIFMSDAFWQLMNGVPLTLALTFIPVVCGALLASLLAGMQLVNVVILQKFAQFYVFIIRGTPLLIQIFLIYYGLGQFRPALQEWGLWSFFREPYWCALLALTLNTAAYGSEIIRGGVLAVPYQLIEAGRAYGMSSFLILRRVTIPIALRQALPAYGNEIILMLKATSLCSVITMMEVSGIASKLISDSFRVLEVFTLAGAIYLTMNFLIAHFFKLFEQSMAPYANLKILTPTRP